MPVLLFVMNLSLIFIIWLGNIQSVAGNTDVGDVVAVINYALRIAMSISMFTFLTMAFSRMKASAGRIAEVLEVDENLVDNKHASLETKINKGKIEFNDVSFTYPGYEKPILKHITFTVNPREKLAIIGATGSGKTT